MLRARQRLGKYRIDRKLAEGGFAIVYRAYDTIEAVPVALKVPRSKVFTEEILGAFRKEARIVAGLEHPNILPIKNATFIGSHFVIAYPLGERALSERLRSRMSLKTTLSLAEQMLEAVAHAHSRRVIHCDIKPENFIIFDNGQIRLTDFGIAKVALSTRQLTGAGTGTLGYLAPEQAFGKPSFRSDVFSLGLLLFRMFTGSLPEWPYAWPPAGHDRLQRVAPEEFIEFLQRAMEVEESRRHADAIRMIGAFRRLKPLILRHRDPNRRAKSGAASRKDWKALRAIQFRRRFGRALEARHECRRCGGPVGEAMSFCPWCGSKAVKHRGSTSFPVRCPRCERGLKADWRFCPWCYGPGFEVAANRTYGDVRYEGRCAHPGCKERRLMPYMRYCPWCRTKVRRKWKIPESRDTCGRCGWGVVREFFAHCPWCGHNVTAR